MGRKAKEKEQKKDGAPPRPRPDVGCVVMASGVLDHSGAICIKLIRRIYRRVLRRCGSRAGMRACTRISTGHTRLSVRILIGSIGYARSGRVSRHSDARTREFFDLSRIKSDYAFTSSFSLFHPSISLPLFPSLHSHLPNRPSALVPPFTGGAPLFASRISLVTALILPRAFSSPNVSLVARQLYLFIRRIGHASRASLKIAPRTEGRFVTASRGAKGPHAFSRSAPLSCVCRIHTSCLEIRLI